MRFLFATQNSSRRWETRPVFVIWSSIQITRGTLRSMEREKRREGERGGKRDIDWIFRSPSRVYVLLTVIIAATAAAMGKIETSIIPVTARKCKQWAVQRLIPLYDRDFARRSNVNGVVEARCEARPRNIVIERRKDTESMLNRPFVRNKSATHGKKKDRGRNIMSISTF